MARREVLAQMHRRLHRQTHRLFAYVAACRWVFTVSLLGVAKHHSVALALALGAVLDGAAYAIVRLRPVGSLALLTVCIDQLVWPAVWSVLVPGFGGTTYYMFGVLAAIALFRDWRVLAFVLALTFPVELFLASQTPWVAIVAMGFEGAVLLLGCFRAAHEMVDAARREATLQRTALMVQQKVETRTRALQTKTERYRALVENTEALPFEYDVEEHRVLYIAPKATALFGVSMQELREPRVLLEMIHHDDRAAVTGALDAFVSGERSAGEVLDYRVCVPNGVVHLRTFFSALDGKCLRGLSLDVTSHVRLEQDLRQAQKLESVGRLAAGVAHEINTPVQFIGDSLEFVQSSVMDLISVVREQRAAIVQMGDVEDSRRAREAFESAEIDFVASELPKSIERAVDGIQRIATIVKSMKVFARQEGATKAECDLRQAIESTLVMARSEYKDVADVEFKYDEMPQVVCRAGEINQVVLNLVVNAGHAIAEVVGSSGRRGRITVQLRQREGDALISIRDTGSGIPDGIRERIFEQFFTTKPVGQGAGLGLALAHSIVVERHQGSLTFDTGPDGTTFHVTIPIDDSAIREAA